MSRPRRWCGGAGSGEHTHGKACRVRRGWVGVGRTPQGGPVPAHRGPCETRRLRTSERTITITKTPNSNLVFQMIPDPSSNEVGPALTSVFRRLHGCISAGIPNGARDRAKRAETKVAETQDAQHPSWSQPCGRRYRQGALECIDTWMRAFMSGPKNRPRRTGTPRVEHDGGQPSMDGGPAARRGFAPTMTTLGKTPRPTPTSLHMPRPAPWRAAV